MIEKKTEFSKILLIQEAYLIWIMSLSFLILAFYCIYQGFTGSLPWLAAMVGFPWTAYGVSQAMYYRKAMAENTKDGIKYETVVAEAKKISMQNENEWLKNNNIMDSKSIEIITTTQDFIENIDEYQI